MESGLGFAVDYDKPDFIGREAVKAQKDSKVMKQRLVLFQLEDDSDTAPLLHHGEPIFADGECVGVITSGAWGHRIGKSLGIGWISDSESITLKKIKAMDFEIEVALKRYKATAQLKPWYDPKSERVKA